MKMQKWSLMAAAVLFTVGTQAGSAWARSSHTKKRFIIRFQSRLTTQERDSILKRFGVQEVNELGAFNASVVEDLDDQLPMNLQSARRHPKVLTVEDDSYRNWLLDAPSLAQLSLPTLSQVMEQLRGMPGVDVGAARKTPVKQPHKKDPNGGGNSGGDAGGAAKWADKPQLPWGIQRVNAPAEWDDKDPSSRGAGVKVAVVDTGIDCTHPNLNCKYSDGMNILDNSQPPADDNEHGTHVSGTIAGQGKVADGQNATPGVFGVAPLVQLMPVKVIDASGSGTLDAIVSGIMWATDHGAQVINMSLGGDQDSPTLHDAVKYAHDHGVVVVCAAGNSGPNPNTVSYPAAYPESIAVAASDDNDQVADFSSRGPEVALIAPGVDVLSTVPGGGYAKLSGTSMASPHMAGLAALAVAKGIKDPDQVRAALIAAASTLVGLQPTEQGSGMLDATKIGAQPAPHPTPNPSGR